MKYYSVVDKDGYIKLSQITDMNYTLETGERILPDEAPDPQKGDYEPGRTKPVRVEPVPNDATKIQYNIVNETGASEIVFIENIQL